MDQAGIFITIEGGEGGGKSTQIKYLSAALEEAGAPVILTREPGGTKGGEAIRKLLVEGEPDRWDVWSEFLLLNAARQDHGRRLIKPELARGRWVLSDRYYDSSRVYQGLVGGIPLPDMDDILFRMMGLPKPDLTIILDLCAEKGLKRVEQRQESKRAPAEGGFEEDRFERKGLDFHKKVRRAFLVLAAQEPHRFVVINADQRPEKVAQDLFTVIQDRYRTKFHF